MIQQLDKLDNILEVKNTPQYKGATETIKIVFEAQISNRKSWKTTRPHQNPDGNIIFTKGEREYWDTVNDVKKYGIISGGSSTVL